MATYFTPLNHGLIVKCKVMSRLQEQISSFINCKTIVSSILETALKQETQEGNLKSSHVEGHTSIKKSTINKVL